MRKMNSIKVIAFDAGDTLWVNEPYFQEAEQKFCGLLEDYLPQHTV
jgi:putative hydrolase of the HAD superfamily